MIICIAYFIVNCVCFLYFEWKDNKKEVDIGFFNRRFTCIAKGIAITMVFLSHVGNANNVRVFAPWGGVGVAVFLIASGYGLSESLVKGFHVKQFVFKRISTVIIPYLIVRLLMIPITPYVSIESFILDVLCIRPQYILGWYLTYIIFWYMVFCILQLIPEKYKQYDIIVYLIVSVIVFLFADSALQAQQAFSFTTGIIISKKKDKILEMMKYAGRIFFILTCIGGVFFICKQMLSIANGTYLDYFIKMGYRYIWGVDVFIIIYIFQKYFKFTMFEALGIISYEIFLIHGYFIESGVMNSLEMLIPCIIINIVGAIILQQVSRILKNLLLKKLGEK